MEEIYLIDDDKLVNYLNREMIHAMAPKSQILTFESAAMALASLHSKVDLEELSFPQLIFLDINMPFIDGWEFLAQYAQFPASFRLKTKIYLLSSSIDKHDLDRASANPYVFDYLIKPLNDEQLEGIGLSV
jgi:CheY-like chemotaxis protein